MSEACRNKFQQHSSYMLSSWQIYLGLNFPLKSRLFRKQVFLCRNHSFCSFSTSFRQQQWKQEPHDQNMSHLKPVIRPTSKLHLAVLVVEGEPGDVNLAGGLERQWFEHNVMVCFYTILESGKIITLKMPGGM